MLKRKFKDIEKPFIFELNLNVKLPKVLLALIFSFCPLIDIKNICLTCKLWKIIINSPIFIKIRLDRYAQEISEKYNFPQKNYLKETVKSLDLCRIFKPRLKKTLYKNGFSEFFFFKKSNVYHNYFYKKNIGLETYFTTIKENLVFMVDINSEFYTLKWKVYEKENSFKQISIKKSDLSLKDIHLFYKKDIKDFCKNKTYHYYTKVNSFIEGESVYCTQGVIYDKRNYKKGILEGKRVILKKNIIIIEFYEKGIIIRKTEKRKNLIRITYFVKNTKFVLDFDNSCIFIHKISLNKHRQYRLWLNNIRIEYVNFTNKRVSGEFYNLFEKKLLKGSIEIKDNKKFYKNLEYFNDGKKEPIILNIKEEKTYFIFEENMIFLLEKFD